MKSRAAVAFGPGQPLSIVEIDVAPPKKGEVLVKITHTGVCHTDAFTLSGDDPEGVFPAVLGHEGGGIVVEVGEGANQVVGQVELVRASSWSCIAFGSSTLQPSAICSTGPRPLMIFTRVMVNGTPPSRESAPTEPPPPSARTRARRD